jgi:hypothetical protein
MTAVTTAGMAAGTAGTVIVAETMAMVAVTVCLASTSYNPSHSRPFFF